MLNLPLSKFILVILIFYLFINLGFALLYFFISRAEFHGLAAGNNWFEFKQLFYFSTQTFTTVGYGRINPVGDIANFIAGIEALTGFLSLAIATGLIYGRFSKPKSYLIFSDHALVSPYKGGSGLMFRFAAFKDKHALTELEIRVVLGLQLIEDDTPTYKYFTLELERSRVESMPMSWTVVHPLNENSPLNGFTKEDMEISDVELYIYLRGFDEVFSTYVQQRTSYTFNEIIFNRKFIPMYKESEDRMTTILELHKLNFHKEVSI